MRPSASAASADHGGVLLPRIQATGIAPACAAPEHAAPRYPPTRFAMRVLTVMFSASASDSNRFHVSTGRRTLRTAVGLRRGRPRRTTLPTAHEGISHRDQSAMPSAGS